MNGCTAAGAARVAALLCVAFAALPAEAGAQTDSQPPVIRSSRGWIEFAGASTTILGDCTDCEADTYLHTGSVLAGGGVSLNPRADLGAEVLWVPLRLPSGGYVRSTLLLASVRVRPWRTRGFFLKGASGMAFLRNWEDVVDEETVGVTSKGFTMGLGAGWEWRVPGRLGFQIAATQHVVALGDLAGRHRRLENVVGNFWSVGGGVMIR